MIFYSRENGRDGEKDYIDTEDFKDVYFEEQKFSYLKDGQEHTTEIQFELEYMPDTNAVEFVAKLRDNNFALKKSIEINPVDMVEQGAIAYYEEELLDSIDVIVNAKEQLLDMIKTSLIESDCLLKGTNIDVLGLIENGGNTLATFDDITIVNHNTVKANKFYSIVNVETIITGTATILLSNEKKIIGEINSITKEGNGLRMTINNMSTVDNDTFIEYTKSKAFDDIEEYHEDRARFISVETTTEADFDEFDDLF